MKRPTTADDLIAGAIDVMASEWEGVQAELVAAACKTKSLDPSQVKSAAVGRVDVVLRLESDEVVRVEISALPASLVAAVLPLPETTQAQGPPPETLDNLTVPQLRDLATERGLDVPSRIVKADLIALLESE